MAGTNHSTTPPRSGPGKWAAGAIVVAAALGGAAAWGQTPGPVPTESEQVFATQDGLITVQHPAGDGWDCLRSRQRQDDSVLTTIKCRRSSPAEFFFLTARDYLLNDESLRNAKELSEGVYRRSYEALYSRVKYVSQNSVKHFGRDAYDVKFDAQHDRLGSIRKVERVIVEGRHILILSAEGSREIFEQMLPVVERWFSTTRFRALPPMISPPP